MICPSCDSLCSAGTNRCPDCGAHLMQVYSGVMRTSTVLISSGDGQVVYPSLRDVPEPLRGRVRESTTGRNSGTILIADRRGKERIERATRFHGMPQETPLALHRVPWSRVWPALVALAIGALGAWVAFVVRF